MPIEDFLGQHVQLPSKVTRNVIDSHIASLFTWWLSLVPVFAGDQKLIRSQKGHEKNHGSNLFRFLLELHHILLPPFEVDRFATP